MSMLLDFDSGFFSNFVTADDRLSHWHEDIQQRSTILITIGDSWTWGDSLGTTNHALGISDPNRVNLIYGRHLQKMIGDDCDWINVAYPGTANRWIVDVAKRFPDILDQCHYKSVFMSVGLTDMTRDHLQRGNHPNSDDSFLQSLEFWERDYLVDLAYLCNQDINLVVARNFTSTFESNINLVRPHLSSRWIDITAKNWQPELVLPRCIGMKFPDNLESEEKLWAGTQGIPASLEITNFLNLCPLHYKRATKHPTEMAHLLWAQFVYENLGIFYPDSLKNYGKKEVDH